MTLQHWRMNYSELAGKFENSVSIRLLRADHAPLILAYLHDLFKRDQRPSVPYQDALESLQNLIEGINEESALNKFGEKAETYLKNWANTGYIRIYARNTGDDRFVELTNDSERVLGWLESLEKREFVGTESRLLNIYNLLEEITVRSTQDAEQRIALLERQKAEIEQQIAQIRASGEPDRFNPTQIRERFIQAEELASAMLRDFREIEGNFKQVATQVYEAQLQPNTRKGDLLGKVLDMHEGLRESDQGRSFYAAWEYLRRPERQDRLRELVVHVYALPELAEIALPNTRLRNFTRYLTDASQRVIDQNRRLAENLRHALDENTISENRRLRAVIAEIKAAAIRRRNMLANRDWSIEIEGDPDVMLPMERDLYSPSDRVRFTLRPLLAESLPLASSDLDVLYSPFYVDAQVLARNIADALLDRLSVTLAEVIRDHPVTKGVAELVAYLTLASQEPTRHTIDPLRVEEFLIRRLDETWITVKLPRVTFRKYADE